MLGTFCTLSLTDKRAQGEKIAGPGLEGVWAFYSVTPPKVPSRKVGSWGPGA